MLKLILVIFISYILGNFATSMIVAKLWANIDIRKHGSGNAGATNVVRTLGFKAGLITFIGDALKGVLAVWVGKKIGGESAALFAGIAVVIGHNWPVAFGFKGGKGIATTIGVALMVKPIAALICISLGLIIVFKTKYVSLASLVAICLFPIVLAFSSLKFFIFGLILAFMAVYKHRANIERLLKGTESKFGEKSRIK